jgi:hypothetical protein
VHRTHTSSSSTVSEANGRALSSAIKPIHHTARHLTLIGAGRQFSIDGNLKAPTSIAFDFHRVAACYFPQIDHVLVHADLDAVWTWIAGHVVYQVLPDFVGNLPKLGLALFLTADRSRSFVSHSLFLVVKDSHRNLSPLPKRFVFALMALLGDIERGSVARDVHHACSVAA